MAVSLSLYALSVFQPWVVEDGWNLLVSRYYNIQKFWSFQLVIEVFRDDKLTDVFVFRFFEYWTPQTDGRYAYVYQGWVLVLAFQILTVISGAVSILKQKVRGKPIPLVCSTICSIATLIVGYFQSVRQFELVREHVVLGYIPSTLSFDIGLYLALISVILWIISLSFDQIVHAKIE